MMGEREDKEIAMKWDLGTWFFKHMDRISETTSKIADEGQVTAFKMETMMLEASLWAYIQRSNNPDYWKSIQGWDAINAERENLKNKLTAKHLGDEQVERQRELLDIKESLTKIKGLMIFALEQGITPGYKPPEKKFGLDLSNRGK